MATLTQRISRLRARRRGTTGSERRAITRQIRSAQRTLRRRSETIAPQDYFSPEIDIARRAAERGYGDQLTDFGIARQRGGVDFQLGQQDIARQRSEGMQDFGFQREDLSRQQERSLADIARARERGGQDYQSQLRELQRQYGELGKSQTSAAVTSGIRSGRTLAEQARLRAEGQQRDRQPLDTAYQRQTQDLTTQEQRLGQDYQTATGRLGVQETRFGQGLDRSLGDLARSYDRQFGTQGDMTLQEQRVRREQPITQYDLDLQQTNAAVQAGVIPQALGQQILAGSGSGKPKTLSRAAYVRGLRKLPANSAARRLYRKSFTYQGR